MFIERLLFGCSALVFPIRNQALTLVAVARPLDDHPALSPFSQQTLNMFAGCSNDDC